jgi:hypothetical protein
MLTLNLQRLAEEVAGISGASILKPLEQSIASNRLGRSRREVEISGGAGCFERSSMA